MFSLGEKAVTLPGYWFPWLRDGKYSLTDGEQIFSWEE